MFIAETCNWTPYGTDPELDKLVDSTNYKDRRAAAKQGYGLDKLVYDEDILVREQVAKHGYGLDILVNDEYRQIRVEVAYQGYGLDKLVYDRFWAVRAEVAKHGYGLDILVHDEDNYVRMEVAKQGYGLDILVHDEDNYVRMEVAKHGYGLNVLVNDKERDIRLEVAKQGYGLDILINDTDKKVRNAAAKYLKKVGYKDIFDWARRNPDKACRTNNFITTIVQDFIYKANDSNKLAVQTSCNSIDEFFSKSLTANEATITICSADTKNPIVKFQKTVADNRTKFMFIAEITDASGDNFTINSAIISQKQLNALIQQTVEVLRADPQLNKYADDLEDCLSTAY